MTQASGGDKGMILEQFENKDLSGPAKKRTARHINESGRGWEELLASGGMTP